MNKHNTLPIQFDNWDECGDLGDIQFYNAEFLEDFGPFKAGEVIECLARMDALGILSEQTDDGTKGREIKIKYQPA